uniref:Polypeptide N-acetylgalactosaminyltransferase n=1 Tax=Castor canadensis TaxID=51338 RepID=A0A8B7V1E8_CASCN|nr:polypeptide N-acetylgalactosaminyltransferase 10-like [Castor canadensis]
MALFPSVRILRTKKREGLIRTRMLGASAAIGDVITFLDSHCEANVNWLPPLLDRIARNRKTIVCPMIDVIDHDDFRYETQAGDAMRGAFDWELYYKRIPIPPELQKADPSDPFESPVMAGGLFAVDRKWFWELGGYDPGLEIWGGEQYEISFKVWMCGGRMEDIPCSRVGHIYRKYVPYKVPAGVSLARNLKRVAEVWMDEYAEYIYQRRPEYRHLSSGDVAAQKKLRSSLNCKSFRWFMTKIAWDLPKFYPPVEPPAAAWGEIRNVGTGLCADTKHGALGSPLRLESCVRGRGEAAWNNMQVFTFTWREDIRPGDPQHTKKFCFDAVSHTSPVTLYDCHSMKATSVEVTSPGSSLAPETGSGGVQWTAPAAAAAPPIEQTQPMNKRRRNFRCPEAGGGWGGPDAPRGPGAAGSRPGPARGGRATPGELLGSEFAPQPKEGGSRRGPSKPPGSRTRSPREAAASWDASPGAQP